MYPWIGACAARGDVNRVLVARERGRPRGIGFKSDKFSFRKGVVKNWFTKRVVDELNRLDSHFRAPYIHSRSIHRL